MIRTINIILPQALPAARARTVSVIALPKHCSRKELTAASAALHARGVLLAVENALVVVTDVLRGRLKFEVLWVVVECIVVLVVNEFLSPDQPADLPGHDEAMELPRPFADLDAEVARWVLVHARRSVRGLVQDERIPVPLPAPVVLAAPRSLLCRLAAPSDGTGSGNHVVIVPLLARKIKLEIALAKRGILRERWRPEVAA